MKEVYVIFGKTNQAISENVVIEVCKDYPTAVKHAQKIENNNNWRYTRIYIESAKFVEEDE